MKLSNDSSIRLNANPSLIGIYVRYRQQRWYRDIESFTEMLWEYPTYWHGSPKSSSRELKENITELSTKEALETLADLSLSSLSTMT